MTHAARRDSPAHEPAVEPHGSAGRGRPVAKIARLAAVARGIYYSDQRLQFVLLGLMLLLYGPLLRASWKLKDGGLLGLTFNSMLDNLLHGHFYVDPQTVQYEAHWYGGHSYAYWGIWCALLRLPLWIVGQMDVDMTVWSCLAAACLGGMAKVRTALLLRRHSLQDPIAGLAICLMLTYILLGGSGIGSLGAIIYQEVISWSVAFGSVFVYFGVKGLVNRQFDLKTLSVMSLCAGLALLTRVTTGVGLSIALVLLLMVLALEPGATEAGEGWPAIRRMSRAITERRMVLPAAIFAVMVSLTGAVNYFRWGNPTTFVRLYNDGFNPALMTSAEKLGLFSFGRIPFGLVYYFFPVWVLQGSNGQLILEKTQSQLLDMAELPPSSFFLTDLLAICFIVLVATALWKRRCGKLRLVQGLAIAVGLLAPCILMLMLIWMAYRYRVEFYPEIDFLAFLGLYLTVTDEALLATFARWRRWMTAALVVSVLCSFVGFSLNCLSMGGPAEEYLDQGIVHHYSQEIVRRIEHLKVLYFRPH